MAGVYGYDVGAITKALQQQFLRDPETGELTAVYAHPEALQPLVDELRQLTDSLIEQGEEDYEGALRAWGGHMIPDSTDVRTLKDMSKWLKRLDDYEAAIQNCLASPGMEELYACTFEPVTKPLLLGQYPDGTDGPIDAVTPFDLANRLGVTQEWAEERWSLFKEDLKNSWPVQVTGKAWDWVLEHSPAKLLHDAGKFAGSNPIITAVLVVAGIGAAAYIYNKVNE